MTKQSNIKTNAMRLLDRRRIPYEAFFYPDTVHSAEEVAALLGIPANHVFKTLVVFADGTRRLLVITPGDRELDMRLVAKGVNAKAAQMAPQREAERLTGLKVGGISPLALTMSNFEVYLDESGAALEEMYINGGMRGVNVRLRVADLLQVTGAKVIQATHAPAEPEP
ncbi:MAG TPA: aminoacyl-tRNA deacylase [Ktedonobacterales bacterium]|nr:aminoacyl-tRNA deacylase [Ktedonobacterales bacterium]